MKIPKFKRLSANQKRDFDFYMKSVESLSSFQLIEPNCDYESSTLEEWYFLWDTHGLITRFSDMQLCGKLTQSKDALNLTISLWIEDFVNESLTITQEEVWEWCHSMPKWVWKSFKNKINSLNLPFKFQRVESLNFSGGKIEWIPPWMIDFTPKI